MFHRANAADRSVLVVEDDAMMAALLSEALSDEGYRVEVAYSGTDGLALVGEGFAPQAVILDLWLPDASGIEVCSRLRSLTGAPILVCSADVSLDSRTAPLRSGADMFLSKPFDLPELLARVEALIRRAARDPAAGSGGFDRLLHIDRRRLQVTVSGRHLELSATEFRLLCVLAERAGEVVSYQDLAQHAYRCAAAPRGRGLTNHMSRLRRKLGRRSTAGPDILVARGRGYRLTGVPAHLEAVQPLTPDS